MFAGKCHCIRVFRGVFFCLSLVTICSAEDLIELKTGAKVRGRILSEDSTKIVIERRIGTRRIKKSYPKSQINSVIRDGQHSVAGGPLRTKQEVLDLIDSVGRTPPDWYDETPLNYPKTLDLTWPHPAPKGWNSSKNVGQYIWDRINTNPGKWQEGVKLMHHIMSTADGDRELLGHAIRALGTMYHNLHEDYARAAFWWQQAGIDKNPDAFRNATVHLANCYYQLGNKQMALDLLNSMERYPYVTIKLLGDMGETARALKMADSFAKSSTNPVACYLYGGDVCRVAGRIDDAENYYQKALDASKDDKRNKNHAQRDKNRAEASLAAIRFYKIDPQSVKDGTYTASSIGYEDQVHISVTVAVGKITDVTVTKHREKQFYSSIKDTPRSLIAKQSVVGIDTTSGATITSEAIINATAKALSQGANN